MIDESTRPADFYVNLVSTFRLSRAVWCAAHFHLADAIGDDPKTAEEIAAATQTNPAALRRLLDVLTAAGLFRSEGEGVYGQTPLSDLLRSDHPQSQRGLVDVMLGGWTYQAWEAIEATLRTGEPAFEVRHGMSWIDYYLAHPDAGRAFAEAMSGTTRAYEDAILAADPFPPFRLAVDIGGSHGSLLRRLLVNNPEAKGIVFDLPGVIAGWPALDDDPLAGRLTGIGGSFFETVPEGADLYLLKYILHDWDDEKSEAILRRVRKAIAADGHVALVEVVLPESPTPHKGWLNDFNMLAITGGQERSESAFSRLLDRAGFNLDRVIQTGSPLSVILASPHPGATPTPDPVPRIPHRNG